MCQTQPGATERHCDTCKLRRAGCIVWRYIRASNKSPRTVETYGEAVDQLGAWLSHHDDAPATTGEIRRAEIEAFLIGLGEQGRSASTMNNRYRSLHRFFGFVVDEGEAADHPMTRMTPPQVPDQPVDVLTEGQIKALLADCKGRAFVPVRDTAVIRLMIDTGVRRAELLGMAVEDVDLDQDVAYVLGKGRRERACPFGRKAAMALDRYVRHRTKRRHATNDRSALALDVWRTERVGPRHGWCGVAASASASVPSTRTSCATRSRTAGSPTGERKGI